MARHVVWCRLRLASANGLRGCVRAHEKVPSHNTRMRVKRGSCVLFFVHAAVEVKSDAAPRRASDGMRRSCCDQNVAISFAQWRAPLGRGGCALLKRRAPCLGASEGCNLPAPARKKQPSKRKWFRRQRLTCLGSGVPSFERGLLRTQPASSLTEAVLFARTLALAACKMHRVRRCAELDPGDAPAEWRL